MIDGIFFVNLHMEKGQITPKNTCIIIGNGFDINLGLPTSYTDFVKSTHFNDMVKRGNELAKYLKSKFELQNWIDIENELKTYSLERSDASFKSNYELLICRYDGHQYALPLEADPTVLCVNTELLKKEGITVPRSGFTLEEFYQVCRQVTKDTNNDGILDQFGFADYTWKNTVQAYGAHLFSPDGSKSYFNSKKVRQALVMSEKFYNLQKGFKVSADDFDQGKVAFLPMTLAQYRTYKPYPYRIARYSSFRWTCIKMPAINSKVKSTAVETSTLALSSRSKHPILALRFLKFLSANKKIQEKLLADSQGASVLPSVMTGPKTQTLLAQGIKDDNALTAKNYAEIMDNATVTPKFRHYSNLMEKADYLVERALNEGDIDAQLSDIQEQLQVELEK